MSAGKRPTHKWAIDQDYWAQLSDEEKEWLRQFNAEYYRGQFPKMRRSLHPKKLRSACYRNHYVMRNDALAGSLFFDDVLGQE